MSWLRMASRVALLGNIAFVACVVLRYVHFTLDPAMTSLLLILGWFAGLWYNVALTLVLTAWRTGRSSIPSWLFWVNAVFGAGQLYYFFFI